MTLAMSWFRERTAHFRCKRKMKDDISYVLVQGEDRPFPLQEGKMKDDISYVLVPGEDGPFPLQKGI